MTQLDNLDRKILTILQDDGRIAVTALADQVGLSPNATAERMRRMQREGIIVGYRALLNPKALGRGLTAFIEVRLDRTSSEVFDNFARVIRRLDGVEECHMVAGGFDYLLKTRHRDMEDYRAFLSDTLVDLPGVRETRTYAVMEAVVEGRALPLN